MYKNYIFSLYGTLLDVQTDEKKKSLWIMLRDMYASYGIDYTPEEIRDAYHYLCKSEMMKQKKITNSEYPEINIENVFVRLLLEAPKIHKSNFTPVAWSSEDLKRWAIHTGLIFRIFSREYFNTYVGVIETLEELKKRKCRLFLVANAQSIFTMPEIEQSGIAKYFDDVYLSSDMGIKKPDPNTIKMVFDEHKIRKSKTVYVGSNFEDGMQCAINYGIDSIFVNKNGLTSTQRRRELNKLQVKKNSKLPVFIKEIKDLLKVDE